MDVRIERLQRRATESEGTLSLAGGLPLATLLPNDTRITRRLIRTRDPRFQTQSPSPEGSGSLRHWIAARLAARGVRVSAEDVIITSGAQQALTMVVDVLDLDGAFVGVDLETYPAALELFRQRGAIPTGSRDAAAHYVVPGASNPRGLGLGQKRRQELLEATGAIIADEAYAELRYDSSVERPLLLDAPERVFHVGTFSKTLGFGVRLGWLIGPPRYRRALMDAKRDVDLHAPRASEALVDGFLQQIDFDAHLTRSRTVYRRRMDALMSALAKLAPELSFDEPEGGFSLFASSEEPLDELVVLELATRAGTSFDPGSMFRPDGDRLPFGMRMCPCNVDELDIEVAVSRLVSSMTRHGRQRTKDVERAPRSKPQETARVEEGS